MTMTKWSVLFLLLAVVPVLISYVVDGLRSRPVEPEGLSWAPDIAIKHVEIDGVRLRYITTGEGPPLVLLHTLRTQLDIFQKIIPELSRHFTVYAFDYPGHGWSDISGEALVPEVFYDATANFLEALDINDAVVAGVSIGGTIPLVLAARHNPRISKVISINPYDYGKGGGLRRSSGIANLIFTLAVVPVLGDTVMRLRNPMVERMIFEGGVFTPESLPPFFLQKLWDVGTRAGYHGSFLSLIRNAEKWEDAREEYQNIQIPVLLVYGDQDWSHPEERTTNQQAIPGSGMETVPEGSHFLPMDRPQEVIRHIMEFSTETQETP
ncbi:MAG: alpha/beta hydrolase [Alphaproteobacteria bacterium]|nr:alpha/beta hydrolase [Alphaproteobacteria bacterium]